MKFNRGARLGLIFGLVVSLLSAFIFMFFGQIAASGGGRPTILMGEAWLYYATLLPFILGFTLLGGYFEKHHKHDVVSSKKLWLISLYYAFLLTLFSGTVGALLGETIVRGGLETVNVEGTLIWGTIYAFVLIPLTWPFFRFVIHLFVMFLEKFKVLPPSW